MACFGFARVRPKCLSPPMIREMLSNLSTTLSHGGTSSLILIVGGILVAWIVFKMVAGFIKFAAMCLVILVCASLFVPSLRTKVLDRIGHGVSGQVASLAETRCEQNGMSAANCKRSEHQLMAEIQSVCYGKNRNWKSCHTKMETASAWINMPCMHNARVANDCVKAVVEHLKPAPKS
jgi:hypothetical protein